MKIRETKIGVFSVLDLVKMFGLSYRNSSAFINYYLNKGLIIKLRNGLYTLKENAPSDFFVAGRLYQPSYISLETALSYYGVIPETVYSVTSVTTRKTARFETLGKSFVYRKIKNSAFNGYYLKKSGSESFYVAFPEKALADYLYFCFLAKVAPLERINLKDIKRSKVSSFVNNFENENFVYFVKDFFKERNVNK